MSLKYIANRLGISTATVSNVINGKGRVSKDVEKKVFDLMRAESIDIKRRRKKRNHLTRGYIVLAPVGDQLFLNQSAFHEQLLKGIRSVLKLRGYSLLIPSFLTPRNFHDEIRDANAALLVGFKCESEAFVSTLPIPVVWLFLPRCNTADTVHEDHKEVGRLAAQHLFSQGHRVVGFIDDQSVEALTEKGFYFTQFMAGLGGKVVTVTGEGLTDIVNESEAASRKVLRPLLVRLLSERNQVTALFIPGTRLLAAVSAVLRKMKKDIEILPCVSVVPGWDGCCEYPAVIDINLEEIGKRAAECVFWRIDNPNSAPIRITVRPTLITAR